MEHSGVQEPNSLGFSNEIKVFLRVFLRECAGYEFENVDEKGCYLGIFTTLRLEITKC
jgi:hypothetical protein